MRSLIAALVAVVLVVGSITRVEAGVIIGDDGRLTFITPGPSDSTNIIPFGGTNDVRYQQIYDASLFNAAPGPIEIFE
jgi:hypothetical protein